MRMPKRLFSSGLAAAAIAITACAPDGENSVLAPIDRSFNLVSNGYVDVSKFGPEGIYSFEASETGSGLYAPTFTVAAGATETIWSEGDPAAPASDLTITELPTSGQVLDSILVVVYTDAVQTLKQTITGTNSVTLLGLTNLTDARVKFYNSLLLPPPPPPGGTEGCTPGYWKQSQHFDSWVGYSPSDSFDAVFGVTYGGTLLSALESKGGGAGALARHAVAALLNAGSSVDYAADTAGVIAAVQAAFASGNFETQKNIFEGWNELGCPLN